MLRHFGQCVNRARQRPERSTQDIVAIDPRRRGKGDRKRGGGANFLEQFLAALGRQPLGIVDAFGDPLGVEHDGRRHHRTCQRPAPGLVAAGHRPDAALDQRPFAAKARRRDRDDALERLGLFHAGLLIGFFGVFLGGLVPNHAGIVRKRGPGRNRKPGTIPVIQRAAAATPRPQSHKRSGFRAWDPQWSSDGAFRASRAHEWTERFADRPARAICRI